MVGADLIMQCGIDFLPSRLRFSRAMTNSGHSRHPSAIAKRENLQGPEFKNNSTCRWGGDGVGPFAALVLKVGPALVSGNSGSAELANQIQAYGEKKIRNGR